MDGEDRSGVQTVRRSGMPTVLGQRLAADLPLQAAGVAVGVAFIASAGADSVVPRGVGDAVVGGAVATSVAGIRE
jgi:hypothetical protein